MVSAGTLPHPRPLSRRETEGRALSPREKGWYEGDDLILSGALEKEIPQRRRGCPGVRQKRRVGGAAQDLQPCARQHAAHRLPRGERYHRIAVAVQDQRLLRD